MLQRQFVTTRKQTWPSVSPSSKETKAYTAAVASNKALAATAAVSDSDYSACHVALHGSQFTPPSTSHIARHAVFDHEFVPHTPGTVLNSGANVNIFEGALGSGTRIQLTGIRGDKTQAEMADAVFTVIAANGSRHAILVRGKNIVATHATDNILSLAVLLQAGYQVNFRVGTALNPTNCSDIHTPIGKQSELLSFSQTIFGDFQCGVHLRPRRPRMLSLLLPKTQLLPTRQLSCHHVRCTLLNIACILTTLTVLFLGVTRRSTI